MDSVIILLMTMSMLIYFLQKIWRNKNYLLKYLSQVGGKRKVNSIHIKPPYLIPFIILHVCLGFIVGNTIFSKESDGTLLFRLLLSSIMALSFLLLLLVFYFILVIIIKEIISMRDMTIIFILLYSILSFIILFWQLLRNEIVYPKGFIWINVVLYVVNLFGIGRIIWTIFKKQVLVKSIWSIAFMNITFVILALSNITFEIQNIFNVPCYSRVLKTWGEALYFVVISFFTVGYGDLYPVHAITKILSMIIIITGFTFTAVFVSAALSTTIEHFGNIDKK